jgi:hypothetical protein
MKTHTTIIVLFTIACAVAVPGEAQLKLVRGNPI